ncbi:Uncharacterised protein [Moraxella lacunata]|uniref:Uncharacterized protein n=1 Tax=Moraxella lacunata TaxID=477 RepID=A0A1V4H308_MORLA|nr:hypothetical protein [Moraxella lacunata]OPH39233.1 hypothetical protein B5J94_01095 [Moraxella lacunata]STZ00980.1 Uncharacterised protein [Moraxella lacunata]
MSEKCLVVFTYNGKSDILSEGVSGDWRLSKRTANACKYIICVQLIGNWGNPEAPPHTAFLIGKISDIQVSPHNNTRYEVYISEYADINIPNIKGTANPVSYRSLDEFEYLDINSLEFKPVQPKNNPTQKKTQSQSDAPLTIPEAKRRLALTLGVSEENIMITINH